MLCLVWALSILPNWTSPHPPQKLCHSNSATPQFVSKTFRAMKYTYFFIKIQNHIFSGAHNYNYFLTSLPQLNEELAYTLTKSTFTITMMKWILMLCNLCKTSYNVLIHSHVIILELKFWGEFRFPEVSISVNVDLWNEQFYSKEQTSIRQLSETLYVLVVFLHLNKGLDAWGKFRISHVNSLRKTSTVLTPNMDALACGCKPRICSLNCYLGGNLSRKVLLMEFESGNVCI